MHTVTQLLSQIFRIQTKSNTTLCKCITFQKTWIVWEKSEPERGAMPCGGQGSGRPTDGIVLGIHDTMYVALSTQDPACHKCSINSSNEEK